jgi:hypothetical protein
MATRNTVIGLFAGAAILSSASATYAQAPAPATEKYFVNMNFGGQLADRATGTSVSKTVYDETATLVSTQPIGRGLVFDFGGGYRVWEDVYVALVVTRFSNTHSASYTATIPHPFFFSSIVPPKTVTGITDELKRTEVGIDPHVLWVTPLTDKIDVSVGLGLSVIKVKEDLLSDFDVPAGTQDVSPILGSESKTAKGVYAAVDFIYGLTPRYGVGGYVRYAGGKVTLDSAGETNVGGLQVGGGIRLRF